LPKVRVGFGLGTASAIGGGGGASQFAELVDGLEAHGFDSLWLSERVTGAAVDPIVGLSVAVGRTSRLKLGFSVLVLPGRNPVLLAKELASLDHLSGGRLLPAFGLGVADPGEQQAFGVERSERAARFDEALPLLRRLWSEDAVDHDGRFFRYEGVRVRPKPVQQPLEVWLGGRAPSELRRVGRLGDGWLPSFCTPADAAAGRAAVERAAEEAGRAIDPEHWGALVAYVPGGPLPERLVSVVASRQPGIDPSDVVPSGHAALREQLARFVDVGFSKFVVVPAVDPTSWTDELDALAREVVSPLQSPQGR
jgi:probable F420-dependent oxidoreductase